MIKVLHVISALGRGGAEMMLHKLVSGMDRTVFPCHVVSLMGNGAMGSKMQTNGVPVTTLGMNQALPNPLAVLRLAELIERERPHVIQTWLYHADLIGSLAARWGSGTPVAWNIRTVRPEGPAAKRRTRWTIKACAAMARRFPARIVCCAESARKSHVALGYTEEKMVVIPNGFDLAEFKPDPSARESVRAELGAPREAILIGLIARFDPQKDHRSFVQAAAQLSGSFPNVHFLLCGEGVDWANQKLAAWIESAGIRGRCHLLGDRDDIPRLTAALDLATSSSYMEGFPNAVGEAMACEAPCVVTDVGDSAWLVGDTGKVVPARDPQALVQAWSELLTAGPERRKELGQAARRRVEQRFSLPAVVAQYQHLYEEIVTDVRNRRRH